MFTLRAFLTALLLLLVTGCGNLQVLKIAAPPEAAKGRAITLAEQPASDVAILRNAFPVGDGTIISQSGGGSVVAGVMFGAVGALLNTASIAAESERVRKAVNPASVARIQPALELAAAWKEAGLPDRADAQAAMVEAFLVFYLDDARENVYVTPGLRVTGPGLKVADGSKWVGHYLFAIDKTLPPQRLNEALPAAELAEHASTVRAAYRELLKEVAIDLRAGAMPKRKLANIKAPALKATGMGFAGFTAGDIELSPDGRLAIRVSIENYGPAMSRAHPYFVWVFPAAKQYAFELGPEERQASR
jgi:hypothetical protein